MQTIYWEVFMTHETDKLCYKYLPQRTDISSCLVAVAARTSRAASTISYFHNLQLLHSNHQVSPYYPF